MNIEIVKSYLTEYKKKFDFVNNQEIYKWKAVKQFQDNWDINAPDFHLMLEKSLKYTYNLLDSGQYFPKRMLLENAKKDPKKIKELFKDLYEEDLDIFERIELFRTEFSKINQYNFEGKKDYQDHRAVIVYLALNYPERYFFYKFRMFKEFAKKIDYTYNPIAGRIENVGHFQNLCNLLRYEISQDQELLKLHKNRISDEYFYDENLNILTQDFVYAVVKYLEQSEIAKPAENIVLEVSTINSSEVNTTTSKVNFTPTTTNYIQNNIENKRIGDLGELWVINYEKQKLLKANKSKLSEKVKHVAKDKGDGLGYDILSFDTNGNKIFIEVKTTKGKANSTFYITRNELEKSIIEQDDFYIYRVFNYDNENIKTELLIIKGDLTKLCEVPLTYKVNMKKK